MSIPIQAMQSTPVTGWRFHPTPEELVADYLKPKTLGHDVEHLQMIGEVNFCKFEPWDLPNKSKIKSNDEVWYFLCPRDPKRPNSKLCNRKTKAGYWKGTGKHIPVKAKRTKKQIGWKKTLVFHLGCSNKGTGTEWIVNEFEWIRESNLTIKGDFVLCKLKKKPLQKTSKGQPNQQVPFSSDLDDEPGDGMTNTMKMTTTSICDESQSRHPTTFGFDGQSSSELATNSACNEIRPSHFMACNFGDKNSNEMAVNSAFSEAELGHYVLSSFGNQVSNEFKFLPTYDSWSNEMVFRSAYSEVEPSHNVLSVFGNQTSNELQPMSTENCWSVVSDVDNWISLFDFEGEFITPSDLDTHELQPMSTENCPSMVSDVENWISLLDFEGEYVTPSALDTLSPYGKGESSSLVSPNFQNEIWSPTMEVSSNFKNQSPYDKGETSNHMASGFEYQDQNQDNYVSFIEEGEWNSLKTSNLDFGSQNPYQTFMSSLGDSSSSYYLLDSSQENDGAGYLCSETNTQPVAELGALVEQEDSLHSVYQTSVCTMASPSYNGFGSSMST